MMTDAAYSIPARSRHEGPRAAAAAPSHAAGGRGPGHAPKRAQFSLKRMLRRMMRRPVRSMLQIGMLATGAAIAMNALLFQTARHPAPWGSGVMSQAALEASQGGSLLPPSRPVGLVASTSPAQTPATAAMPPAANRETSREIARETARVAPREPLPRGDFALSGMQAPPVPPAAVKTVSQPGRDPIGDLIRGGEPLRSAATAQRVPAKPRTE